MLACNFYSYAEPFGAVATPTNCRIIYAISPTFLETQLGWLVGSTFGAGHYNAVRFIICVEIFFIRTVAIAAYAAFFGLLGTLISINHFDVLDI